jgi:pyridoxine kinase
MISRDRFKEENVMKRVLTIQDISCLGKCSLTIALPVISALGVETVILPTAVLSTHTMFKNFTCKDLSDQIEPITRHWKDEDVKFDAIYTGYLGTIEQIDQVKEIFKMFKNDGLVTIVDPVMADNGKLYPAFDMDYVKKNAQLCAEADIVVPNITEASFMTGMDYREEYDEAYIKELLSRLNDLGAKISVITGVSLEKGKTGVMGYDRSTGEYYVYQNDRIDASYHGTGDLFSSTCVGEMMKGLDWRDAMRIAADYTAHTIEVTLENPEKPWYGVDFEKTIPELIAMK